MKQEYPLAKNNLELQFTREKQVEVCDDLSFRAEEYYKNDLNRCQEFLEKAKSLGLSEKKINFTPVEQMYPPAPFLIEESKKVQDVMQELGINPYSQTHTENYIRTHGAEKFFKKREQYDDEVEKITHGGVLKCAYGYEKFQKGYEPKPYIIVSPASGITQYFGVRCKPATVGNYVTQKVQEVSEILEKIKKVSNGMSRTPFISKKEFNKKFEAEAVGLVPRWLVEETLLGNKEENQG
ncbi:MAG: hypothetical protein M3Q34_00160 [bacterium]|nr:hypothetical protein [bacterium]